MFDTINVLKTVQNGHSICRMLAIIDSDFNRALKRM